MVRPVSPRGGSPKFLKTPLALFRGFQLASGVGAKINGIHQAVLENYFEHDRLSKLYQARLLTAAILGLTGIYIIFGGFHSLIWTEFVQTIMMSVGAVIISVADPRAERRRLPVAGSDTEPRATVEGLQVDVDGAGRHGLTELARDPHVVVVAAGRREQQHRRCDPAA